MLSSCPCTLRGGRGPTPVLLRCRPSWRGPKITSRRRECSLEESPPNACGTSGKAPDVGQSDGRAPPLSNRFWSLVQTLYTIKTESDCCDNPLHYWFASHTMASKRNAYKQRKALEWHWLTCALYCLWDTQWHSSDIGSMTIIMIMFYEMLFAIRPHYLLST